jgi:hypothetical protein
LGLCSFKSRPNQSKLQLTNLLLSHSSTNLMLIPTTNSSQIRRYRSPNFDCQSNPRLLIQSSLGFGCDCRGRPAAGHRRRVATWWQPYTGRGPTCQVTASSRGATEPPLTLTHAPALSLTLSEPERSTEAPLPPRASSRSCTVVVVPRPNSFQQQHHNVFLYHLHYCHGSLERW